MDSDLPEAAEQSSQRKLAPTFNKFYEELMTLKEGLITSYGSNNLKSALFKRYKSSIMYVEDVPLFKEDKPYRYGRPNSLSFVMRDSFVPDDEFHRILNAYGYFITNQQQLNPGVVYLIEPKYPRKMTHQELANSTFFHITTIDGAMKILQTGLLPRPSSTNFNHPGNRAYMMVTNKPQTCVCGLKRMVAEAKSKREDEVVALEIDASKVNGIEFFIDEAFDFKPDYYYAVFTLKAIHPKYIKLSTW